MKMEEIREDVKKRYYYAIESNDERIIDCTIAHMQYIIDKVRKDKQLAQSDISVDVLNMIDILINALYSHEYILKNY